MRCPSCGFDADPKHPVCAYCGNPLPGTPMPPWHDQPHPTMPHPTMPGAHQTMAGPHQVAPPGQWPASGYQILDSGVGPGSRRPPWAWLVAVLAVIFISAAAAGVILKLTHKVPRLSAPPPASASAADGRTQANAIDALLNASSATRTQLGPALDHVESCGDLKSATATLEQIVTERDDQVRRGQSLAVDQLANGEQLRTLLVQALTYSLQADQKFVAWAHNASTACTGHAAHDGDYAAAQAASSGATTSKQSFVQLWNPVATRYGLATRSESGF
jgi:hypothetical protein